MDEPRCPICSGFQGAISQEALIDYEYGLEPRRPFVFYECHSCGSEYMHPRPTVFEINSFYPQDYHAYSDETGTITKWLLRLRNRLRAQFYVRLLGGQTGRLFDVGPGDCRHFDSLKAICNFEFCGIELNPLMAAKARERGYNVIAGTLETADLHGHEGHYDLVSMYHVLEHVVDPPDALRRVLRLLRPNGWVVGQLPNKDSWERRIFGRYWVGYHFPRHLQALSRHGLLQLLVEAGFRDVRVIPIPHLSTAISVQNYFVGTGWKLELKGGRSPIFPYLLGLVAPFELAAYACGRTGHVNFLGRKP